MDALASFKMKLIFPDNVSFWEKIETFCYVLVVMNDSMGSIMLENEKLDS